MCVGRKELMQIKDFTNINLDGVEEFIADFSTSSLNDDNNFDGNKMAYAFLIHGTWHEYYGVLPQEVQNYLMEHFDDATSLINDAEGTVRFKRKPS